MRTAFLLPALLLTLACSSKLERGKAEDLIRKNYPVMIPITVPLELSAERGTPDYQRLTSLKDNLEPTGWFDVTLRKDGVRDTVTFRLRPNAPKFVKAAPKGFQIPVAEGVFVRALALEKTREGARVGYEVRLEKPTAQFPLYQAARPEVKVGDIKVRHATFERRNGSWMLTGTDETLRKAE